MVRYEKVLLEQRSDLCLVVGDVTSTMACSVVARKLGVPVAAFDCVFNRHTTDGKAWFFANAD